MQTSRALEIVETLASGVDPLTGEVFAKGSMFQHADIVRALFQAAAALRHRDGEPENRAPGPPARSERLSNAGKPWSEIEDQQLAAAFDSGVSQKEIAAGHGRSLGGIRLRLVKLGRIEPEAGMRIRQAGAIRAK